ncbi:hypothetical protein [Gloeobacter violaceus]|uniref:Gll2701 protein n=1 Tax=Gloeobacter violaceus (strain ATCC 29082 / PCC 7421) TaxID=251221 RepID=Q7NH36_GLOVI|nr:hypothetical protein [Gloeobacter violaceus]BAC90642.1 gll2701 [Gloeobacter violaceus PCC 7421]
MQEKSRRFDSRWVWFALLGTALGSFALRSVVAGNHIKVAEEPLYPVFVLPAPAGELFVVEHSRNQILKLVPGRLPTVIAGNGTSDYSGDGGPATRAGLFMMGIARDRAGNLYIADHNHHRVRRVGTDGRIETIAGTGEADYGGDGGPAKQARFNDPAGVAVDALGNVLVADTYNHRIRTIGPDGTIRTVAGTGQAGYSGDGGPATAARLDFPWGVAVAPDGRILIADTGNNRIRSIGPDGTIRTVAGTGQAGFGGDGGPAVKARLERPQLAVADHRGNLFVADTNNNRVRRIAPDGTISTVAGGEPPAAARLNDPFAVGVDERGHLYIADTGNFRVLKIDGSGRTETLTLK